MSIYVQYHNYDKEGLPHGEPAVGLGIHTRLTHVMSAIGGQVLLIFGIGNPRRYFLWDSFTVEKVRAYADGEGKTAYHAFGSGWYLAPPQLLEGSEFDAFKKSCANFVGFRKVDGLPFSDTLKRLADEHRPPGSPSDLQEFVQLLGEFLSDDIERKSLADHFQTTQNQTIERKGKRIAERRIKKATSVESVQVPITDDPIPPQRNSSNRKSKPALVVDAERASDAGSQEKSSGDGPQPRIKALSIRQPHAEAILQGIKKIEYRSGPTKIRGRICIYASLGRYSAEDESEMLENYGMDDVDLDKLPRGVIVGTVELFDCDGGDWHLRNPKRADKLQRPKNHPQPVWFHPF